MIKTRKGDIDMLKKSSAQGKKSTNQVNSLQVEELMKVEKIFQEAEDEFEDEFEDDEILDDDQADDTDRLTNTLISQIEKGGNIQEALRDVIHNTVKDSYKDEDAFSDGVDGAVDSVAIIKGKQKEIYEIMENIDGELAGKSTKEVSAFFVSLLDIQSQLCLQKTDGVIAIRTRMMHFFPSLKKKGDNSLRQEITLIFSPEEVKAMRMRFADMSDEDPLKAFFTTALDQAYDVVQYNEMTGNLLLEMSKYFIQKLVNNGYGDTTKTVEFKERHERAKLSLGKAIDDLREIEMLINYHLQDRPILVEFPKYLRALIQIKLGLLHAKHTQQIIQMIKNNLGQYARARSAVAFDFNRLPSYQHGVRLRQSIILNLHKDVLEYTGEMFEQEFRCVQDELKQMMSEIESSSETLDPNSPEYEEMMAKKIQIQQKLEMHRRKLDVVRSQEKLVDVQHKMCNDAIKRYNKQEGLQQKLDEDLASRNSIDPDKVRNVGSTKKKKISRMVMAKRR